MIKKPWELKHRQGCKWESSNVPHNECSCDCFVLVERDEIERLRIEVANRAHSEEQYRIEIERLSDKVLRFDLDQAGIEYREGIAIGLVEAKAEIERLREDIAQWLEGQGQPGYAHEVRYWRR